MLFSKAILLLLALHLYMASQSQTLCTGSFKGQVLDSNNNPLAGASIVLSPGDVGQSTNASGAFAIDRLCRGSYIVKIQFVGYKNLSVKLTINGEVTRKFRLQEEIMELNEVVIQHHDAEHTEHATNLVELNERQLSESAGKSLGETLKEIPGVTSLQTGPGIFKPVIHGVHSQRLLILNHGIRQEGQQWGAEHAPEIDPFVASNIVVVKDASAIKYGTDALGGVVIVNPAPLPETNELGGTVASIFQSNGRSAAISGMLEGGVKKHSGWGWRVQGTAKRTGDFETPDYALTNTGVKEQNFSAATGYHQNKFGVDLFFSRFQTELGILRGTAISNLDDLVSAMEREVPLYASDFSYDIQEPRQKVSHNLFKINGHINTDHGEWRFQYGFQNNNRSEYDLRIGDLSKIPAIDLQLNTHSLDAEWETNHTDTRTISFGLNTLYQKNTNVPGTQRIPFIPNFESLSGGIFATSKFFFSKWTLDGGLRFDYRTYSVIGYDFKNSLYSASFDFNNISASAGITRKFTDNQTGNLNISTSWRSPHVSELYSVGTHQSAAAIEYGLLLDRSTNEVLDIDDASVPAEQAVKVVGSYQWIKENLNLTITPYVNYIFNYVYLRPEGITRNVRGVYPYFRYAQTDALFLGADIDASVKLAQYLTVSPKVSLLKAKDVVNDDYFLFVPSNRYSIDLRYGRPDLFGVTNTYLESKTQYVSHQFFSPPVVTVRQIKEGEENNADPFNGDNSMFDFAEAPPGYFLWNVAAGFSIKSNKVQYDLRLACDNVLDQRYREYTNRFRYYADDLGRNFILSVKCIF